MKKKSKNGNHELIGELYEIGPPSLRDSQNGRCSLLQTQECNIFMAKMFCKKIIFLKKLNFFKNLGKGL